jgi:hypothetical protein
MDGCPLAAKTLVGRIVGVRGLRVFSWSIGYIEGRAMAWYGSLEACLRGTIRVCYKVSRIKYAVASKACREDWTV